MVVLSTEILAEIFSHLHQFDKLKCMFVCHQWKNTIERFSLYDTLYLFSSRNLNKLAAKLKKEPKAASQTKQVVIYFTYRDRIFRDELNALLELLPNLKILLNLKGPLFENDDAMLPDEENKRVYPWARHVTHLSETEDCQITQQLFQDQLRLSGNACANLTSLHINLRRNMDNYVDNSLRLSESYFNDNFLENFKYLPALTRLKIEDVEAHLYQLDILHSYLPRLTSVAFDRIYVGDRSWSDNGLVPAAAVTECLFHFQIINMVVEKYIELLTFIYKKYPNLTHLSYVSYPNRMSHNDIQELNQRGWVPLFRQLGPQIKTLWINHSARLDNRVEMLDQCHQLTALKLGYFPLQNEIHTQRIQRLELSFSDKQKLDEFDWLSPLRVLKKLKLTFSKKSRVQLNSLIDHAPPTLTTLSLSSVNIVHYMRYSGQATIETLSLTGVKLAHNMDTFLSRHFPRLTRLKLCRCNLIGTTFVLSTMDLGYFRYTERFEEDQSKIAIITRPERRLYLLENNGKRRTWFDDFKTFHRNPATAAFSFPYTSRPIDAKRDVPDFTLVCRSVRNIDFLFK